MYLLDLNEKEALSINMRSKRLAQNTIASLIFQVTSIICGFVLPQLILRNFGSDVNGLVNSISQFLSVITFLELGLGAVVQSALYKPLAERDYTAISKIVVSAGKFFKRLAYILLVYVIFLMLFYPQVVRQDFGWFYTAALIGAISISSFAQYYFGIVDRLLLTADQRGYIQYNAQTITLILNTVACAVLISLHGTIHMVKLATSMIYLLRPVALRIYVNKHYSLNRKISYVWEPIRQKWNGVAQHISAVILDSTDLIVLTLFATLADVSIYSVYHTVVYGVKQLFISMTNGIQALIGELWAKQELEELQNVFGWVEWSIHTGAIFVFGCTAMLVLPFIQIYTLNVHDANYIQPLFAVLITMAHASHCLRLPYSMAILAGGHYRQTQSSYIIAAGLNIVISIALVNMWGLIGVALGTLISMAYQTVWMAVYNSKHLIKWPLKKFGKQILVDGITILIGSIGTKWFILSSTTYFSWVILAFKTALVWIIIILMVNVVFYREKMKILWRKVFRRP